jgi:ubiquinol-cytochrome c reductase cytochrome c1 subunit
MVYLPKVHPGH